MNKIADLNRYYTATESLAEYVLQQKNEGTDKGKSYLDMYNGWAYSTGVQIRDPGTAKLLLEDAVLYLHACAKMLAKGVMRDKEQNAGR